MSAGVVWARRRRPVLLGRAPAALAAAVLVTGCSTAGLGDVEPAEARVYAVEVHGDGRELQFYVDVCARPLVSLTVDETPDRVTVTATTERGRDPDACALIETRVLDEPLGDREVVDGHSGEVIERVGDLTD